MSIEALDHVNLRTHRIESARAFYVDALGLDARPAGDGKRQAYRLTAHGHDVIHLVSTEQVITPKHQRIERFALRARDLRQLMGRLDSLMIPYNLFLDNLAGVVRLNLRDPDDNRLHVDFPIDEHEPDMAPMIVSTR